MVTPADGTILRDELGELGPLLGQGNTARVYAIPPGAIPGLHGTYGRRRRRRVRGGGRRGLRRPAGRGRHVGAERSAAPRGPDRNDPPGRQVAEALVHAWPLLAGREREIDGALADPAVGGQVPAARSFHGTRACNVIDYALGPGPARPAFLTAVVRSARPELIDAVLARLAAPGPAGDPDALADRLVGPGGIDPDAVPLLFQQLLATPNPALVPLLVPLLDRHRADRSAVRAVLERSRGDIAALFAIPAPLLEHIWPEPTGARRWWHRRAE